jgi:hypothetical protein
MSVDWMRALADALSVHFPQFKGDAADTARRQDCVLSLVAA